MIWDLVGALEVGYLALCSQPCKRGPTTKTLITTPKPLIPRSKSSIRLRRSIQYRRRAEAKSWRRGDQPRIGRDSTRPSVLPNIDMRKSSHLEATSSSHLDRCCQDRRASVAEKSCSRNKHGKSCYDGGWGQQRRVDRCNDLELLESPEGMHGWDKLHPPLVHG